MSTHGTYMRESDAFTWHMEHDPELRSTVVAVVWLEGSPPFDALAERLERATRLAPSFRRRITEPTGRLTSPRWVTDADFDLTWHLRRVGCPPPGTPDAVLELARIAAMTGFDPTRPLWEFTLVEGVEGGRAALVLKLHHSLSDGLGGVQLAPLLFDASAEHRVDGPFPAPPPGERLTSPRLLEESLVREAGRILGGARALAGGVPRLVLQTLVHPFGVARDALVTAASIGRTVEPVTTTLSPVMTGRGPGRRLHTLAADLSAMRAAGAAAGGSVNDAFLAALTGGLRRYHERHGASVDDLMVTMPISLRTEADPAGGNRITLQRFRVPVGLADPVERMRALERCCRAARTERSLPYTDSIAGTLNLLPSGVVGSMLKHVDFLASDVPGFPAPVYLCGERVTACYPFGPTIGAALNATLFSYDGTCCIGVTVDSAAVPDDDVLLACLREGIGEVAALGDPERAPKTDGEEGPC